MLSLPRRKGQSAKKRAAKIRKVTELKSTEPPRNSVDGPDAGTAGGQHAPVGARGAGRSGETIAAAAVTGEHDLQPVRYQGAAAGVQTPVAGPASPSIGQVRAALHVCAGSRPAGARR